MGPVPCRSPWDALHLLQGVQEVAGLVGEDGLDLTQRRFDDARDRSRRFATLPRARGICELLGLPWSELLRLALMPLQARDRGYMHAVAEGEDAWLTPAFVAFAVRLVANRLDQRTLAPAVYDAERQRMLDQDKGRWMHGGQLRLPSAHQVIAVAGTWDRALAHAGLAARRKAALQRRTAAPSILDVLDRCYEAHGTEPTQRESELFGRANGIPYPRRQQGRSWASYIREWKKGRLARGQRVPAGPPPRRERPDYSVDVGAALPGERRGRKEWGGVEECVGWVVRLRSLHARERSSQRGYDAWARSTPGAPWSSAFDQHGGWATIRALAWARLRTERSTAVSR